MSASPAAADLRCPDCFGTDLAIAKGDDKFLATCRDCSRELTNTAGVLQALPKSMAASDESNRDYYDSVSTGEENLLARRARTRNHRAKFDAVIRELGLDTGGGRSVLELGVGYGAHGAGIVGLGHQYFGIDISPGLLTQAARRFPELSAGRLICGDATRTPFRDETFDGVFCVATLHHLERPEDGIREALRVLRPGGRFCFLEPRRFYPTQFVQWARHRQTEISAMKITERNLRSWTEAEGAARVDLQPNVFTPNGPGGLVPLYDRIDRFCTVHPVLHSLSVQVCVSGNK